jgi:hypothetical protein
MYVLCTRPWNNFKRAESANYLHPAKRAGDTGGHGGGLLQGLRGCGATTRDQPADDRP